MIRRTRVVRAFTFKGLHICSHILPELGRLMLDLIMETHAWAAARPKHESANAVGNYEKKIADIMEVEKEQGTSPNASFVGTLVPVGRWLTGFTNLQTVCALDSWSSRII